MNRVHLSGLTEEYVYATTTGPVDPTGNTVQFAFTAPYAQPVSWVAGLWDSTPATTLSNGKFQATAKVLLTPGQLATGKWWVWVQVVGSPESPVRQPGVLIID